MAAFKNKDNGTWYVQFRYSNNMKNLVKQLGFDSLKSLIDSL